MSITKNVCLNRMRFNILHRRKVGMTSEGPRYRSRRSAEHNFLPLCPLDGSDPSSIQLIDVDANHSLHPTAPPPLAIGQQLLQYVCLMAITVFTVAVFVSFSPASVRTVMMLSNILSNGLIACILWTTRSAYNMRTIGDVLKTLMVFNLAVWTMHMAIVLTTQAVLAAHDLTLDEMDRTCD